MKRNASSNSPRPMMSERIAIATLVAASIVGTSITAEAANGTWLNTGAINGEWGTASNWTGGTIPGATVPITGTNNSTDAVTFNTALGTYGTESNPIVINSPSLNVRNITFDGATGNYFIGIEGGNSLYLSTIGTLLINSTVSATNPVITINAPLVIQGTNGSYTFNNNRASADASLILNGGISGGAAGNTALTFTAHGTPTMNYVHGVISNGSSTTLGITQSGGNWTYSADNTYTGTTLLTRGSALFTGNNSGAGAITVTGGINTFIGENSYTGALTLSGGTLNLGSTTNEGGTMQSLSSITLNAGIFNLDNSYDTADRLKNDAVIDFNGGQLTLNGSSSINTTERVGTIALHTGYSRIAIAAGGNKTSILRATEFTRDGRGAMLIGGPNLNKTTAVGSTSTAQLILEDGGASLGLVGTTQLNNGATSDTTKTLMISPFLFGENSISGSGSNFVTYDTTLGLRLLTANQQTTLTAGYVTAANPENVNAGNNITLTNASGITVNSLLFSVASANVLNSANANSLTVESGAIAATQSVSNTIGSGFSRLILGNGEGVFTNLGTFTVNTAIDVTNNGGITKSWGGTLILAADNLYTGETVINSGILQVGTGGSTGNLGTNQNVVIGTTGTLAINKTGTTTIRATGGGTVNASQASSVIVLDQTGSPATLAKLGGTSGATFILKGDGTTTFTTSTPAVAGQLVKVTEGTVNFTGLNNIEANFELTGGTTNSLTSSLKFSAPNDAGSQTLLISGGVMNSYAGMALGSKHPAVATQGPKNVTFVGNQTGGVVNILGTTTQDYITLGNPAEGNHATYHISGGEFLAYTTPKIVLGSGTDGLSSSTWKFSGGRLVISGSITGQQATGAKQAFVWTGGTLATHTYHAANLTQQSGLAVGANTNIFVNGGGTLAPGDIGTVGATYVNAGHYHITSQDAVLALDIGGKTRSTIFQETTGSGKYDSIYVSSGTAVLNGRLDLSLVDGYTPINSDTFTIVSTAANGVSGTFNNTATASAAAGGGVRVALADGLSSFKVTYNTASVVIGSYLADNQWTGASGSDWSVADGWTAFTPSLAGHIAKFADSPASGNVAVNLDSAQTVGGLQFNSTTRNYTLESANGSELTLDRGNAASTVSVVGNHQIDVPLKLASDLAITSTGSGDSLAINGVISGAGKSLTKEGSGSVTLSAASTYSGGTFIKAGTLVVANSVGSATGSGTVTVESGGKLSGSGSVASIVVQGGGTLAPGSSPTILTADGTLSLQNSSVSSFALKGPATPDGVRKTTAGTDYSQVALSGDLTIGGTASLTLDMTGIEVFDGYDLEGSGGLANVDKQNYFIFNLSGGSITGRFATLNGETIDYDFHSLPADQVIGRVAIEGLTFMLSYQGNFATNSTLGGNDMVLTVIPEADTALMLLGGLGVLALGMRRHQRQS